MRKLFFLFVTLLATTTLWAYDFQSGDLYYDITSSSYPYTVEVTYQEKWSSNNYAGLTSAVIPETVTYNGTGYSVTSIDDLAFAYCSSLTLISIANSITKMGGGVFYACRALQSVILPTNITSLPYYYEKKTGEVGCFGRCSSLTSITIPNSITSIGNSAFSGCSSLTSITIPNSVTSIGNSAFSGCFSLTSITIPNSVTSIGNSAFSGCVFTKENFINNSSLNPETNNYWGATIADYEIDGLFIRNDTVIYCKRYVISITIPNNVTSIGNSAFSGCSSLTSITIPNSVTSIGNSAFSGCSSLTSITIPNGVTSIGDRAFYKCSSLTTITIPNSVTSIGEHAFSNCSSLTSITIPSSVTSIGNSAFSYCSSLTSITIPNRVTSIGDHAFSNCSSLTSITIPSSVTSIGEYAFSSCSSLTSITIPNRVTSIGENAFSYCSSLTSITIPSSVTSIGDWTFYRCSSLTTIIIPNSVTSIGDWAFYKCSSLTSITIPNSVTSIGKRSFMDCSSLVSVTMLATTPPSVGGDVFYSIASDAVLYILDAADKSAYQKAVGEYFNKIETLPPFPYTLTIKFYENRGSVEFLQQPDWDKPAIVKATPKSGYVFGCWDDGEIDNPRTINVTSDTTMWVYFAPTSGECGDNLTWKYSNHTLTISGTGDMWDFTATEVPWGDLCGQIHNISLPTGITSIANNAFFACTEISSIILPSSLKKIGRSAFIFCKKLTSITIPDKVTTIGNGAFEGCENLQHISIGRAVTDIGHSNYGKNDVFRNCTSLTSIEWNAQECADFEDSDTSPFSAIAQQITAFTFGSRVQYIPAFLCYEMKRLSTLQFPATLQSIGESAFESCERLTSVTFPGDVTFIDDWAFAWCYGLKKVTFGEKLQEMGSGVFSDCTSIQEMISYAQQVPEIYLSTFDKVNPATTVSVKDDLVTQYEEHPYWGLFNIVPLSSPVENIHSQSPTMDCQKILRDNQLLILRDGKTYNAMGQEL